MKILISIFWAILTALIAVVSATACVAYLDVAAEGRPVVIKYEVIRYDA